MKLKFKTTDGKRVYKIPDDICNKMIKNANKALKNTYPEANEGFAVALLTAKGNMYEGVSYISDTYTLTMHSEAVALAHAALHGEKDIVAITGPNCHICKQLIWEGSIKSGIDTVVIVEKESGEFEKVPISKMMSYPWPDEKGNK